MRWPAFTFGSDRGRRAWVFAIGSLVLAGTVFGALGADVWCFATMSQHRFTAMAMLTGTLKLHHGVALVLNDEQVYNGAGYTNWGFGVPLLQLPFHAAASVLHLFPSGFFPDRFILFLYVAGLPPVLWLALDGVLAKVDAPWTRRAAVSFTGCLLVLCYALYPLLAYRLHIYEETVAYLVLVELYALCAYLHVLRSDRLWSTGALAAAAGFGLLIRATGIVYLGVWCALIALGRRVRTRLLVFALVAAPFVAFLMCSNDAKSASPLSFGYENSTPYYSYHVPIQRFGSECSDTLAHASQVASTLASAFFFDVHDGATPHLEACHYAIEVQNRWQSPFGNEPFFGVAILVLLVGALAYHLARRDRQLAPFVPLAALVFLFGMYVKVGLFAWRYAGDFWPLIVLIAVQVVASLSPRVHRRVLDTRRMALLLGGLAILGFAKHVLPTLRSVGVIKVGSTDAQLMPALFLADRWGIDPVYPSHIDCDDKTLWPDHERRGWASDCAVDTFTNTFIGVPPKGDGRYELRFRTNGMAAPVLRAYVNGRFYSARKQGDEYVAAVDIDYRALTSPTVLVTIEWTPGVARPPKGRLMYIELT